jgi:hypothetical protein
MTTDPTMYSKQTWQYLINEANSGQRGWGAVVDAMRRVADALDPNENSAITLGTRIWWLNVWLLIVTVSGAMTLEQAAAAWRSLVR